MEEKESLIQRKALFSDLDRIAICHRAAFPKSFTSRLGIPYVKKMYEWYLVNNYTFLLCLLDQNDCIAFVGGLVRDGIGQVGSASGTTQYSFRSAVAALLLRPWLLFHPEFISRFAFVWKNIRMKFAGAPAAPLPGSPLEKSASLAAIAVHPTQQGKGYGSRMLKEFESIARTHGCLRILLSVKADNAVAIRSYERNGWTVRKLIDKNMEMGKELY